MNQSTKVERIAGKEVLPRAEIIIDLYKAQGLKLTHFQYFPPTDSWDDEIVMVFQGAPYEKWTGP